MTSNTVSTMLDAVLDPLASLQRQTEAALELAERNKLPRPFIQTIAAAIVRLRDAHDELLDIATTLDPKLCQHEP